MFFFKPNIPKMQERQDVKGLSKALKHKDREIRTEAMKALAEIGNSEAQDALYSMLNSDLGIIAAYNLAKTGDARAVETLAQAMFDGDEFDRRSIVRHLGHIKSEASINTIFTIIPEVNLRDPDDDKTASEALANIGKDNIENLLSHFESGKHRRNQAIENALSQIGPSTIPQLCLALESANSLTTKYITYAMGEIGNPAAISTLTTLLKSDDEDIIVAAASSLGKIGDREAITYLAELENDSREKVQRTVKSALKDIRVKNMSLEDFALTDGEIRFLRQKKEQPVIFSTKIYHRSKSRLPELEQGLLEKGILESLGQTLKNGQFYNTYDLSETGKKLLDQI